MEDLIFDASDILGENEAEQLFDEQESETDPQNEEKEDNEETGATENDETQPAEEEDENQPSERVGEEDDENGEDTSNKNEGSSPSVFPSIARAFRNEGIFPDFDDEEISKATTAEAFAELVEKAVTARVDERVKRADEALNLGVKPDVVAQYENTISRLEAIKPEELEAEGEEGDNLRKYLIYNDLLNKGYSKDKALREIEKSFKANTELDDAKDAYDALLDFYKTKYQEVQDNARKAKENAQNEQKKMLGQFRKMILEDEIKVGETKLDKKTCQKVFDAVYTPTYKDPDTGKLMTEIQRFQKEHPLEYLKQLGLWFVLTKNGQDLTTLTEKQVKAAKRESLRELERKINTSSIAPDGSLRFTTGSAEPTEDLLMSDDWQIG